ncbi:MAG: cell division protein FtsQ/DivIB [Candidatus Omnitrophica bacterium]|nr:cell division protein FtsQ/DivIB [Candidatus Omnitrophota bacterium]
MKRSYRFFNFKFFLIIFSILILFFIIKKTLSFLLSSDYFKIKQIINNQPEIDLSYLKDENIFRLNFKELADQINKKFPTYKIIKLNKQLPDTIIGEFKKRNPVAYLHLNYYVGIDEEAVLVELKDIPINSLPLISGIETKLINLKLGQKVQLTEIRYALELIAKIKSKKFFEGYILKKIDITNLKEMKFFIDGLKVIIGEEIERGLRVLELLLPELKQDLPKIEYIDLRFKEPVVKYVK